MIRVNNPQGYSLYGLIQWIVDKIKNKNKCKKLHPTKPKNLLCARVFVVYFNQLSGAAHPKVGRNTFSSLFQHFFFFLNIFQ